MRLPALVRRESASMKIKVLAPGIAFGVAVLLNLALYVAIGRNPAAVFYALLVEPFLSWSSISEVLLKATPLMLIAQGLAIGFRAKVFNIGAEGQFIFGAIFASSLPVWVSTSHWAVDVANNAGAWRNWWRLLGVDHGVLARALQCQ